MAELPFFLKSSHRFRECFPDYRPAVTTGNSWRETALATSVRKLLDTDNAAELLLSFLFLGNEGSSDDSDSDNGDNNLLHLQSIVWLSDDAFISNDPKLQFSMTGQLIGMFHFRIDTGNCLSFYRVSRDSPVTFFMEEVDALFILLAKHKAVARVELHCQALPQTEPFPVSLRALNSFVGEAQSPRVLAFNTVPLSEDQWRVITFHSNKNVKLSFGGQHWNDGGASLISAMKLNKCPTKIAFYGFGSISEATLNALVEALVENTSLKELTLCLVFGGHSQILPLMFGAISLNRGLQKLDLSYLREMSDDSWEHLWNAVAGHPSLKAINFPICWSQSEERDQILLRSVLSNHVLCELDCSRAVYNQHIFEDEIRPVLQINRIRPVVEAMKHETDAAVRERLFAATILSERVNTFLPYCYLPLKENQDLLTTFLRSKGCTASPAASASLAVQ